MVIALCETVCFVPHVLQKSQRITVAGQLDGLRLTGDKNLFLLFGERNHERPVNVQSLEGRDGGSELPFAAVDQQDVGEGVSLLLKPPEMTADHLPHRGKIVDPFHGSNAKPLVSVLERETINDCTRLATVSPPCR